MHRFKSNRLGVDEDYLFRFQAIGNSRPPGSLVNQCAKRLANLSTAVQSWPSLETLDNLRHLTYLDVRDKDIRDLAVSLR